MSDQDFAPAIEKRTCRKCAQEMPVRDGKMRIFRKMKSKKGGYDDVCCYCRRLSVKAIREGIEGNQAKIDALHLDILKQRREEFVKKFLQDQVKLGVPNIAEIFENVMYYFGGVELLALQNAAHMLSTEPDSPKRQKAIGQMLSLGTKVSQFGFAKKPAHMWTDEELDAALKENEERLRGPRLHAPDEEVA